MKLSELKVGMKVTRGDWSSRQVNVLGIGKRTLFCGDIDGDEYLYSATDGWIIVEPRKKPSERLLELFRGRFFVCETTAQYVDRLALAICTYLEADKNGYERGRREAVRFVGMKCGANQSGREVYEALNNWLAPSVGLSEGK